MDSVYISTRDLLVKLPSKLLFRTGCKLPMDICDIQKTNLMFLIYEILSQRNLDLNNSHSHSLYEKICIAFVRSCGSLTTDEITFATRKSSVNTLDDLANIFQREYWNAAIYKIKEERGLSTIEF